MTWHDMIVNTRLLLILSLVLIQNNCLQNNIFTSVANSVVVTTCNLVTEMSNFSKINVFLVACDLTNKRRRL